MTHAEPINLLLVEDNEADIELTRMAFAEERFRCHLAVTRNGAKAMDYLRGHGPFHGAPAPTLILLDLNMPRMNGRQLLEAIKYDGQLRAIPVMLLTSSQARRDIQDCYLLRANCYIVKPSGLAERQAMVRRVADFLRRNGVI